MPAPQLLHLRSCGLDVAVLLVLAQLAHRRAQLRLCYVLQLVAHVRQLQSRQDILECTAVGILDSLEEVGVDADALAEREVEGGEIARNVRRLVTGGHRNDALPADRAAPAISRD